MQHLRYSRTARILHWVIGVLVLGQIALGFVADALAKPTAQWVAELHVQTGIIILMLMLVRLAWRALVPPPPLPQSHPEWQRAAAATTHSLLYFLLFGMLVSGLTVWLWIGDPVVLFGTVPLPLPRIGGEDEFWLSVAGYFHEYGAWAITALIVLHIGAALGHEWILRDRLIRDRML